MARETKFKTRTLRTIGCGTRRHAVEFVRSLYRDRRLSSEELSGRLRALDDLAGGKLRPDLPENGK